MSKDNNDVGRIATGVRNLDEVFHGGVPRGSSVVVAGPPGAGKTILAQQICFHNASVEHAALYFSTLSEPTAKTLRYLHEFSFFDATKFDNAMKFVDLGLILRTRGLEESAKLIMDHVKKHKPSIVVIDSFRVFDDLARSTEELRKFGYELAVSLMAWETTSFLLGEYGPHEIATTPLFSIVDGLVTMSYREESGEQQRFIQIVKMRGTSHSRDEHSFVLNENGVEVFAPRVTIQREDRGPDTIRCKTHISKLDDLLGEGISLGSSLLAAGVAGTGKTLLLLEFLYRGALAGEKGIIFSFEETEERLRATARGMGWDLDREIERDMIEIVFIPQPAIMVEAHLLMIQERVEAMGAQRVAIDSVSVFLHKIKDPQINREKIFQLASIVQNSQAVGLFATDIPYGANQLSRFGVEETVVDGIIVLSSTEEGLERHRYLEVYKLRNTAHLKGRHSMVIAKGGITIFPRYRLEPAIHEPPPPLLTSHRLATGVPGLDELSGGGLLERSVTLVSGSAGVGKTILGLQFLVAGLEQEERGLYVTLEEGSAQTRETAACLGLPLEAAVDEGLVDLLYLPPDGARSSQLLALLDERIRAFGARRVVVDGVSQLAGGGALSEGFRQLLFALVLRFKSLGMTSILTVESGSLYGTDFVERGFAAIADNILMLRYRQLPGGIRPTLSVVKTRASAHDFGTYDISISEGGMRVGERIDAALSKTAARERPKK